ncbi:MAG: hypothetical protein H7256_04230 [Bdellovibrio sp.]|nr:hypothetical protein [Bdellovibrio sp.]
MKVLGQKPIGRHLAAVQKSKFYNNGTFHKINPTPQLKEGVSFFSVGKDFLFKKKPDDIKPGHPIPSLTGLYRTVSGG